MRKRPSNEEVFYNNLHRQISSSLNKENRNYNYSHNPHSYPSSVSEFINLLEELKRDRQYLLEEMERTKHLLEMYDEEDEQEKWDGSLHLCFSWTSDTDTTKLDAGIRSYIKNSLVNGMFGSIENKETVEVNYCGITLEVTFEICE